MKNVKYSINSISNKIKPNLTNKELKDLKDSINSISYRIKSNLIDEELKDVISSIGHKTTYLVTDEEYKELFLNEYVIVYTVDQIIKGKLCNISKEGQQSYMHICKDNGEEIKINNDQIIEWYPDIEDLIPPKKIEKEKTEKEIKVNNEQFKKWQLEIDRLITPKKTEK